VRCGPAGGNDLHKVSPWCRGRLVFCTPPHLHLLAGLPEQAAHDRTSADGEHTIVVIMVLTCGNAESA